MIWDDLYSLLRSLGYFGRKAAFLIAIFSKKVASGIFKNYKKL